MDTACNVRGLLIEANQHLASLVAQAFAVHAGQAIDNFLVVDAIPGGDLACQHHHVACGRSIACHRVHRVRGQAGIENTVRDLIAVLVGVALIDGLGRAENSILNSMGITVSYTVIYIIVIGMVCWCRPYAPLLTVVQTPCKGSHQYFVARLYYLTPTHN